MKLPLCDFLHSPVTSNVDGLLELIIENNTQRIRQYETNYEAHHEAGFFDIFRGVT
jgi:hypothetical protein